MYYHRYNLINVSSKLKSPNMAVGSVALKLLTFGVSSPAAGFTEFALRNITQDISKYFHIFSSLNNTTHSRALSIITNPVQTNMNAGLESFLTSAFGLTEAERALGLLTLLGLADAKASQSTDSMLSLLE